MEEEIVLCAANSYEQKYYLNPEFEMLPESIKQEDVYKRQVQRICLWNWRQRAYSFGIEIIWRQILR